MVVLVWWCWSGGADPAAPNRVTYTQDRPFLCSLAPSFSASWLCTWQGYCLPKNHPRTGLKNAHSEQQVQVPLKVARTGHGASAQGTACSSPVTCRFWALA